MTTMPPETIESLRAALIRAIPLIIAGGTPPHEDHHVLFDIRERLGCSDELARYLLREAHKEFPYLICVTDPSYFREEKKPSLTESVKAIYEAGGNGWDSVADPAALIREIRGDDGEEKISKELAGLVKRKSKKTCELCGCHFCNCRPLTEGVLSCDAAAGDPDLRSYREHYRPESFVPVPD